MFKYKKLNRLDEKISCGSTFSSLLARGVPDGVKVISFVNPFSYYQLLKSDDLLNGLDVIYSDGALLCHLHSFFFNRIERASFDFSSIAQDVFCYAEKHKLRVAFVGGGEDEIVLAVNNIKFRHPGLNVAYFRSGYFDDYDEVAIDIAACCPHVVVVGMGAPKQELFSICLKRHIKIGSLIFTCGGFLSQTAFRSDYYFSFVKALGLRWLQRAVMHGHVRKKLLVDYPRFLLRYLTDK